MKAVLFGTFLVFFSIGMLAGTPTASCRQCNAKRCFHQADCGRSCACLFEGGKKYKAGQCVQVAD